MDRVYYVVPKSLQWQVIARPGSRDVHVLSSKSHAIDRAKVLARGDGGGTVIVRRRDGTTEATLDLRLASS